jgi:hypothetical protein
MFFYVLTTLRLYSYEINSYIVMCVVGYAPHLLKSP